MPETHLIEVRSGRGEPPSLELRPGVELAPLSVGTGGAWQVSGQGVRLVHLYVYFDGQTLFVQSAEADDPPMIDGEPVPAAWTPIANRCSITFGEACLVFRPAGGDDARDAAPDELAEDERTYAQPLPDPQQSDATAASPMRDYAARPPPAAVGMVPPQRPAPAAPPARPFKPGAFTAPMDDGESTRLAPLEDFAGPSGDQTRAQPLGPIGPAPIRPAAGAPFAPRGPQGPPSGTPQAGTPALNGPPSLLNVPPPSLRKPPPPETFQQKMQREWGAAPPLRKGLIIAAPIVLIVGVVVMVSGGGSPPPPPPKDLSSASSAPTAAPTPTPPPTPPPPPVYPPIQPVVPPPVAAKGTPPVANPAAGTEPSTPPPAASANTDRRERQAADLVAEHAYDQAIRIYEQLAQEAASGQRPQNPAYGEAARILRAKLAAGPR